MRNVHQNKAYEKYQQTGFSRHVGSWITPLDVFLICAIIVGIVIGAVLLEVCVMPVVYHGAAYHKAGELEKACDYDGAIAAYQELEDYRDSEEKVLRLQYVKAGILVEEKKYLEAIEIYEMLGDYQDSPVRIEYCETGLKEEKYQSAVKKLENNEFQEAAAIFEALGDYGDSAQKLILCAEGIAETEYQAALTELKEEKFQDAVQHFKELDDYSDSEEQLKRAYYLWGCSLWEKKDYTEALKMFQHYPLYQDTQKKIKKLYCDYGSHLISQGKYQLAIDILEKADGAGDADNRILDAKYGYVKQKMDPNDSVFRIYLKDLLQASHKGAKTIHDQFYGCEVKIFASVFEDRRPIQSDVFFGGNTIYFHFDITEVKNDRSFEASCQVIFPSGKKTQKTKLKTKLCNDYHGWVSIELPKDSPMGDCQVLIYDDFDAVIGTFKAPVM